MIHSYVRRLLKFVPAYDDLLSEETRKLLERNISVPRKFTQIFQVTASAYQEALKIEKNKGHLPQERVQEMVLQWARDILGIMSMEIEIKGAPPEMTKPCLFLGNHVSYVDIPLLMASVPVVFVAKEEVSKWLVIGQASKKAGTVFVKRDSGASRANAAEAITKSILKDKRSIGIFPAGTTCMTEDKPWRYGAFKIAHAHRIPVQPFRIRYEPLRSVAYIDDDSLAPHLLALLRLEKVKATIEFDSVRYIDDVEKDCKEIHHWTREIFKDLIQK